MRRPSPGRLKIFSMITEPPTRRGNDKPTRVNYRHEGIPDGVSHNDDPLLETLGPGPS